MLSTLRDVVVTESIVNQDKNSKDTRGLLLQLAGRCDMVVATSALHTPYLAEVAKESPGVLFLIAGPSRKMIGPNLNSVFLKQYQVRSTQNE